MMQNSASKTVLKSVDSIPQDPDYSICQWKNEFLDTAIEVVNRAFEKSSDTLFDPRFKTAEGTRDILENITTGVYGEFLPEASSVLLYGEKPCGFCFANLTGGRIANIPIFAIDKPFQGKGLSKYMLKNSVQKMLDWVEKGEKEIEEVNTTTETNNFQALKMYRDIGFKEDYS